MRNVVTLNDQIMKITLIYNVFLLFAIVSYAQPSEFKLDEKSPVFPNQFVIFKVDSLSAKKAFNKTLAWIKMTNNSYHLVIDDQLADESIQIEGSKKLYYTQAFGMGNFYKTKYNITIFFKSGTVKFEVTDMSAYFPPTDMTSGRWTAVNYQNKDLYKRNGKFRKTRAKNYNVTLSYFNELSKSLKNYLTDPIEDQLIEDEL